MRSPIRAFLVALVTMLAVVLVAPGVAYAKSTHSHSTKTRTTTKTTTTKRIVKHPWKKGHSHAKAHAPPHRARKAPAAKHHPHKH